MHSTRHQHRRAGASAPAFILITVLFLTGCGEHSTTGPVASGPSEGEFPGPAVEGIIRDSQLLPGGGYFVRTDVPGGGSRLIWGEDDGSVNQSIHLDTPVTGAVPLADGTVIISQGNPIRNADEPGIEGSLLARLEPDGQPRWEITQAGRVIPGPVGQVIVLDVVKTGSEDPYPYGWYSLNTTLAPYTLDGDTLPRWSRRGEMGLTEMTSLPGACAGVGWPSYGWSGMPILTTPHVYRITPESRTVDSFSGHRGIYYASLSGFSMAPDGTHGFAAGVEYVFHTTDSAVVITLLDADLSWVGEVRVPMQASDLEFADLLALQNGGALVLCLGTALRDDDRPGGGQLLLAKVNDALQPQWVREVKGAEYGVFYLGGDLRENPDGGISVLAFRDDGSAVRPLLLHLGPEGI